MKIDDALNNILGPVLFIPTLYLDQHPKMYGGGRGVEKLGPSQTVENLTGDCTRKKNPTFRLGGRPTSSSEVLQMQTSS